MSPFMLAGWGFGANQPKGQFIWSQRLIELLFVSDIKAIPLAPGVLYDAWPIAHWESYCRLNNFILKSYNLFFISHRYTYVSLSLLKRWLQVKVTIFPTNFSTFGMVCSSLDVGMSPSLLVDAFGCFLPFFLGSHFCQLKHFLLSFNIFPSKQTLLHHFRLFFLCQKYKIWQIIYW